VAGRGAVGEDERVIVRLASLHDAVALHEIYRPYVERSAISFESEVPTATEMARRVSTTLPRHPWLVAAEEAGVVGYAYGHPFASRAAYRWSVETSVYVHPDCLGRGLGRSLYCSLLGVLTLQGYRQAFAGIALPNPASVALHETMGFQQVATFRGVGWKLGLPHDVGWWQRELPSLGAGPPAEPRDLDQIDPTALGPALAAPGFTS
jgi:L-amino acid N-acyltransferase YncA